MYFNKLCRTTQFMMFYVQLYLPSPIRTWSGGSDGSQYTSSSFWCSWSPRAQCIPSMLLEIKYLKFVWIWNFYAILSCEIYVHQSSRNKIIWFLFQCYWSLVHFVLVWVSSCGMECFGLLIVSSLLQYFHILFAMKCTLFCSWKGTIALCTLDLKSGGLSFPFLWAVNELVKLISFMIIFYFKHDYFNLSLMISFWSKLLWKSHHSLKIPCASTTFHS